MDEGELMRDDIFGVLYDAGACSVGTTPAMPVPAGEADGLDDWLERGYNAGMEYMHNWRAVRLDPRLLLEGARTVISIAFPYQASRGIVASYALGDDYHEVLRGVLSEAVSTLKERYGGEYRICVDSAPILERYWAERCGVGVRGRNGLISVPGVGSRVFLAEIVTTLELPEAKYEISDRSHISDMSGVMSRSCKGFCPEGCRRCLDACPAGALQDNGRVDARCCLSYLTIEHRGDWDSVGERAMKTPAGRNTLFGCELCLRACPMNSVPAQSREDKVLSRLRPRPEIEALRGEDVLDMTQPEFSRIFRGSPIKRAKLAGLQRNARNMSGGEEE